MRKLFRSISMFLIALGLSGCGVSSPAPTALPAQPEQALPTPTMDQALLPISIGGQVLPTPTGDQALSESTVGPKGPNLTEGQALPKLTGTWQISLAQTGGFAGVSRRLEISSNGEMTLTDERSQKQSTVQLSADKFARLKDLVVATQYRPITQPLGCADCFIYDLQIDNGSEKFQVQIDDVNLPNSGLQPLISFLAEMLNNK
jgi:hypothetical protein